MRAPAMPRTADARRRGTDRDSGSGRADGGTGHRARAELRPTGHQPGRDARPEDAQRQQDSEASMMTSAWSMEGSARPVC
jgi:hypothetical protein